MSNKRIKEMKNLSADELTSKLRTTESELFQVKIKQATGQLNDTAQLWRLRKETARIKTLQTQAAAKK